MRTGCIYSVVRAAKLLYNKSECHLKKIFSQLLMCWVSNNGNNNGQLNHISFFHTVHMACINVLFYQVTEATQPCRSSDSGGEQGHRWGQIMTWWDVQGTIQYFDKSYTYVTLYNNGSMCLWNESFNVHFLCPHQLFTSPGLQAFGRAFADWQS